MSCTEGKCKLILLLDLHALQVSTTSETTMNTVWFHFFQKWRFGLSGLIVDLYEIKFDSPLTKFITYYDTHKDSNSKIQTWHNLNLAADNVLNLIYLQKHNA